MFIRMALGYAASILLGVAAAYIAFTTVLAAPVALTLNFALSAVLTVVVFGIVMVISWVIIGSVVMTTEMNKMESNFDHLQK